MKKRKKSHRGKATVSRAEKTKEKQGKSVPARVRDVAQKSGGEEKKERKIPAHVGFQKGDPRINRTIPGPGRPPGKFARKCRRVLANPKTWRAVRRTLKDEENPHFKGMWAEVANRGHGRQGSAGIQLELPNGVGGEDGEEGQSISAVVILMNKIDTMAKRKEKAQEHLKESA